MTGSASAPSCGEFVDGWWARRFASFAHPTRLNPWPLHVIASEAKQSMSQHRDSWMDGLLRFARTAVETVLRSRDMWCPSFAFRFPSSRGEAAGNTGCVPHSRSRARCCAWQEDAHEHTGSAEASRPSLRNGFTAYLVLFPERTALLPPSPLRSFRFSRT